MTKEKFEKMFENIGHFFYHNPIKSIVILFIFVACMVAQLPNIMIDTSPEGLLHKDDPRIRIYRKYQDTFGISSQVIIMVTPPTIYNNDFLNKFKLLHDQLNASVPYVRDITSLINVRNITSSDDVIYVNKLIEKWREDNKDLNSLKETIAQNPLYWDYIVTKDGTAAAIIIDVDQNMTENNEDDSVFLDMLDDGETFDAPIKNLQNKDTKCSLSYFENEELFKSINKVVDNFRAPDFPISIAGVSAIDKSFNSYVLSDLIRFVPLIAVLTAILSALLFKRVSGVILPSVIVNVSMVTTLGFIVICNCALSVVTSIIIAFLLAVGNADSIHILSIFYRHYDVNKNKEKAIVYAMGHSSLPVVLTSLTTIAGLLSFSFSEVADIAEVGVFAAFGCFVALLFTIVLIPSLLSISPVKSKNISENLDNRGRFIDKTLLWFSHISTAYPKRIIISCVIIFLIAVYGTSTLEFRESYLKFLPKSDITRQNTFLIDDKMAGTVTVEAIIDSKVENGVLAPLFLKRIEEFTNKVSLIRESGIFVGKIFSINDLIKETNRALNDNDPKKYSIPDKKELIMQEMLLLESTGTDELESIINSKNSVTRVTIKIPYSDNYSLYRFTQKINNVFNGTFKNSADITITGIADVIARSFTAAGRSIIKSYIIAFFAITILMVLLLGDWKYGLISMVPNVLPIISVLGIMGLTGVDLDLNGLLMGSIAMGLVVDDTMHFLYNFRKYYQKTGDVDVSVKETMMGTGRAMLFTSLILLIGFLSVLTAELNNYLIFGTFTSIIIVLALIADFTITPAIFKVMSAKIPITRKCPEEIDSLQGYLAPEHR